MTHEDRPSVTTPDTKLLTFQTWVTDARWYRYACTHPDLIPYPLIDRSPCQDPFFDPFTDSQHRRPVISGLCRGRAMRNLNPGDRFLYLTRISSQVADELSLDRSYGHLYFAVAALRVVRVWQSHQQAAADFTPKRYVAMPAITPYPPNLAFEHRPVAAAARACSVVHDEHDNWHLPDDATDRMWTRQYLGYMTRQARSQLRAAGCAVESEEGTDCLQLHPTRAAAITSEMWGGAQMNVMGKRIPEELARPIRQVIARSRRTIADPDGESPALP